MSSTIAPLEREPDTDALTAVEARRVLRSPVLWIGIALTSYVFFTRTADYSAGDYMLTSASFTAVAAAMFVLAVDIGSRDRVLSEDQLCVESVLDADDRARARLLALWPAVLIATAFVAVVFGIERVQGGDRIGDPPGRVSDVVHWWPEVLQPVLLVLLAATAGVAVGRATRHRIVVLLVGLVVFGLFGFTSWAWQWRPAIFATLVQTQPIELELGRFRPTDVPADWWLSAPDQYDSTWDRVVVHSPMAAWHDVYLLGLAIAFAAAAVRRSGPRWLLPLGVALIVVGLVAQFVVAPADFG